MNQKVLIVDDEPDILELLEITLGRMNLETSSACDLATARKLLEQEDFHLCLTDMRLPDGNGIDLVQEIQNQYPHIPVAVITAHGSAETAIKALKSGAFDFFSKPLNLSDLRTLVGNALKLNHQLPQNDTTEDNFNRRIIGESAEIKSLKNQIIKVSRSQAPVFISGDSGSGKELVARAIHFQGPRKDNNFVAINCGAIPAELMESEFFGHQKGSFTGADQDKIGLFQAADGGSLFLDEIADLPLHMQVKLLRAIQEKSIRPLGSQTEIPVNIRIISATHKNLAQEVLEGNLRQDFYYRVNVIEIKVPSLRERIADIPLLVDHILNKLAKEQDSTKQKISTNALQRLQSYSFPGNVRELENILQRASALAEDNTIQNIDLPDEPKQALDLGTGKVQEPIAMDNSELEANKVILEQFSLEQHLEEIEKKLISQALEETRWNKTAAAKKLGMSFRAFRYRLKKLDLD